MISVTGPTSMIRRSVAGAAQHQRSVACGCTRASATRRRCTPARHPRRPRRPRPAPSRHAADAARPGEDQLVESGLPGNVEGGPKHRGIGMAVTGAQPVQGARRVPHSVDHQVAVMRRRSVAQPSAASGAAAAQHDGDQVRRVDAISPGFQPIVIRPGVCTRARSASAGPADQMDAPRKLAATSPTLLTPLSGAVRG